MVYNSRAHTFQALCSRAFYYTYTTLSNEHRFPTKMIAMTTKSLDLAKMMLNRFLDDSMNIDTGQ